LAENPDGRNVEEDQEAGKSNRVQENRLEGEGRARGRGRKGQI
jgi:hypothetical protein